jgi:hypothetical protein
MKAPVFALALLFAGAAFAQSPPAAPNAAAHQAKMMDNLAVLLDLTPAQKTQVQAILQEEHAKAKAAFEQAKASGSKPDFTQMKAMHQQLQQETVQKLTPVLSETQLQKFQVLSEMHHAHFHHGGPAPAEPGSAPQS